MIRLLVIILPILQKTMSESIFMATLGGTKSHKIPFYEIGQALTERGHNVTFLSGFAKDENCKFQELVPKKVQEYIEKYSNRDMLGKRMNGKLPIPVFDVFRYPLQVCQAFFTDETINIVRDGSYDVVILDGAFPECLLGLIYKMRATVMYLNTVGLYTGSMSTAGNPALFSFTPSFASNLTDEMTLFERIINSMLHVFLNSLHYLMISVLRLLEIRYLGKIPNLYDISSNVSFILQNGNPIMTYPRPLLPNVVEIACVHCRPSKPLPQEIEDFVNRNDSEGFVFVSMGSSVKASKMPTKLRRIMVDSFKNLPYLILWKWEDSKKGYQIFPKNVMAHHWFPQQDILGHPKLKAFVTHGGLLSLFESVYHGVPLVTIPVFCDHDANAAKAVKDGYAVKLDLESLNAKTLTKSILTVIQNPTYKMSARHQQKLLRDTHKHPLNESVYWIEYVIRHGGAQHLMSIARNYNFFQYYSIDVLMFYVIVSFGAIDLYKWFQNVKLSIKTC